MDGDFHPIIIKYDGLEANNGLIDLAYLGRSLEGASRLLAMAGHIVSTGNYAKQAQALQVRVLTAQPRKGSYEIPAVLVTMAPAIMPMFPTIADLSKKAATKAVEAIVNHAISLVSGKESEAKMAFDVADTALKEMGHTSRTAIEAIERVAATNKPAVRLLVAPVGLSCATAQVGNSENGAVQIDAKAREIIDAPDPVEIRSETQFDILISELDVKTHACKVTLRDHADQERRIAGEITDPQIKMPSNPYSRSLDAQKYISVKGKAQIKDGEIDRLFISDVVSSESASPSA